jgi:hypothetical protein
VEDNHHKLEETAHLGMDMDPDDNHTAFAGSNDDHVDPNELGQWVLGVDRTAAG